ncbi:MAG: VanZ family protein [Prevotella sp.]|nr:VanZ family protein [Prevotella sp.]
MNLITYFLKTYPFSCLCVVCIWILCLIPIPDTPLNNITMVDKWTHFVMYGGLCTLLWAEYGFRHRRIDKGKTFFYAFVMPLVLGGLIEIVQATCTGGNRSGDIMDFWADAIGVVLGMIIGIPLALILSRRNKGS